MKSSTRTPTDIVIGVDHGSKDGSFVETMSGVIMHEDNWKALARELDAIGGRPRRMFVRPSFYYAWRRRWSAHYLSKALGHASKEPQIR